MTSQGMSAAKKDEAQIEILEQLANQEGMYNSCSAKILNVMKEQDNNQNGMPTDQQNRDVQLMNMQNELGRGNQFMPQSNQGVLQ